MYVFIQPPEDDQQIETCHGESNNKVNLTLYYINRSPYLNYLFIYNRMKRIKIMCDLDKIQKDIFNKLVRGITATLI
jgi:hypothetical protein